MTILGQSIIRAGALAAVLALAACVGAGMDDFDPAEVRARDIT